MNNPDISRIGGVPVDAPLWGGATPSVLFEIVSHLSKASYHFADDSTGEWVKARQALRDAAAKANQFRLDYHALEVLYRERSQLVGFDVFVNAVLKDARK